MSLLDAALPISLRTKTIGDYFEVTKRPRRSVLPSIVPFIPMDAIPQGGAYAASCVDKPAEAISSGTYFERGDILVAKITPSFENGKQALVDNLPAPAGYATTEVIPLRPRIGGQDRRLLFFYLLHPEVRSFVAEKMEGATGRQRVPESVLLELPYPNFDPREQKSIADCLELIQKAIQQEEKLQAISQDLKRAAMRELFTRGLRGEPQKETEIGLVPESWRVEPLDQIATLERGRFMHRPRNEPKFYGGKMPFIQTGDVVKAGGRIIAFSQTLNKEGIAISRVFPKGTILITIAANIGYTGILMFDGACPDSLIAITAKERIQNTFLEYYLQTQQIVMDQRAPKGTQKNINLHFLQPWPIPLPSPTEQTEIVEILDAIDRKIDLHKRKKALLEELFKSLLHKLMTGEIRVEDLDVAALKGAE